MEDTRAKLLGEEKIEKALLKMSIPAIIGMLVNAVYNFVDTMFVGWLGTSQIAAATIVFPIFMLIGAVGLTFGIGSASYISRLLGEKNLEQASKTVSTTFVTTIIVAIICTIVGTFYLEPILKIFGATEKIMPYAVNYARVLVLGSLFTMINMAMNNMLRAEGSPLMSMIALSTGALLNIILDPIFIFTLNLGIKGAAIATVISQIVSTILLLQYYISGKSYLKLSIKYIHFSKKIYSEIMKIGIPTFLRQGLTSAAMVFINNAAVPYGEGAIAAIGIINRIFMMAFYGLFGYNQGFQPVAGFNYGAKNYKRLKDSIKVSIKWTTVYCIICTILFVVLAEPLARIFVKDKDVIAIAAKGLRLFSITLPFGGFMIVFNGLFQALGRATEAAILSIARQGIFLIPSILILPRIFKLNGILISQPTADVCTIVVTAVMSIKIMKEINSLDIEKIENQIA